MSFYNLQVPNCFVPIQIILVRLKNELHLVALKTFCAGIKTKFTKWKSFFGVAQKVRDRHNMKSSIWYNTKNWMSLKCLGTYGRTRQKYFLNFYPRVDETTISFWNFLTFNQLYKDSMTIKLMFLETCLSVDCCDLFSFEKVLVPGSLLNGPPS